MAESRPPPPPAQWPSPLLTPACHNRILGMSADNRTSQYSRPNSEILFSTPFPTCEGGYSRPYQCGIPTSLPQSQAQIQKKGHDLLQQGTGVFHPTRVSTEYRRTNYNNIKGDSMKEEKKKKKECHHPSLPHKNGSKGKEKEKEKKKKKNYKKKNGGSEKKEEECYVPNLPPGIVLPMEWPYPDSF